MDRQRADSETLPETASKRFVFGGCWRHYSGLHGAADCVVPQCWSHRIHEVAAEAMRQDDVLDHHTRRCVHTAVYNENVGMNNNGRSKNVVWLEYQEWWVRRAYSLGRGRAAPVAPYPPWDHGSSLAWSWGTTEQLGAMGNMRDSFHSPAVSIVTA